MNCIRWKYIRLSYFWPWWLQTQHYSDILICNRGPFRELQYQIFVQICNLNIWNNSLLHSRSTCQKREMPSFLMLWQLTNWLYTNLPTIITLRYQTFHIWLLSQMTFRRSVSFYSGCNLTLDHLSVISLCINAIKVRHLSWWNKLKVLMVIIYFASECDKSKMRIGQIIVRNFIDLG